MTEAKDSDGGERAHIVWGQRLEDVHHRKRALKLFQGHPLGHGAHLGPGRTKLSVCSDTNRGEPCRSACNRRPPHA